VAKNLELPTKNSLPVLPLRDIVVFPNMIVPLFVGREKSVNALEEVMLKDQRVLLVTQKDPALEEPKGKDLYTMGTVAQVLQLLKLPDGTVKVLVEGEQRAHVFKLSKKEGYFVADVEIIKPDVDEVNPEAEAHMRNAINVFEQYLKLNPKIPPESLASVAKIDEPHQLADTLASHLTIKVVDKQKVLEIINVTERLEAICAFM